MNEDQAHDLITAVRTIAVFMAFWTPSIVMMGVGVVTR